MSATADIVREQEEGLALLFQRGLELALKVQEDAMAAATAEERARLAGAFHRISRGVRQTAALRARLAGEAARAERQEAAEVVRRDQARAERRKDQVRASVRRQIWREAESEDAGDDLEAELEEVLDAEALDAAFASGTLEVQVGRICEALGLPRPDPPPQGEVAAKPTEGVEAPRRPVSHPPRSVPDSSPSGGASFAADPQDAGNDWRSSA